MFSPVRTRALLAPCFLGVALFCGAPCAAVAQTAPGAVPSASPLPEIGRVTTSDRQSEPLDATARPTYVVTKAQMLLHGDDDVATAVARVPGVLIQRDGGPGALATVSIRGQRGDGVLVLLDGHPIAGAEIGAIDLGAISTSGVERIEVVEGAGSTLYGSGASGGVINIITTRGAGSYRTPVVSVAGGSYGYGRVDLETANLSFAREIAANGYAAPFAGLPPGATRVNADLSSTNARLTDAGTFGDLNVSGSAGFTSRMLGVPGQIGSLTSFARQQDDTSDARVSLALSLPHATTTLDLSGTRETLAYLDPSPAEFGPYLDFSTDARVQASLRNNVVNGGNRLVYGLDLAHGVARNDGGNGFFAATPFAQAGLYAQDSIPLGNGTRAYAGLRAERDGAAGAALTPAVGAIVVLGDAFALRLNAGTAFRVPTAEDLAFPGFANPLLQPERTQNFDATLRDGRAFGGAGFGWFVQTGTNLITLNPFVDYTQPFGPANEPLINQQQSSVAGFVLDAATLPYRGIVTRVSVTDTYRALGYNAGFAAQRLIDRPVFATILDVGYTGAPHNAVAAAGLVANTVGVLDTGGAGDYTTIDGYLRVRVVPHALVSLRVYNLGNARYEEAAGYPMPGRTAVLELSTR